jgi:hypothetical protein
MGRMTTPQVLVESMENLHCPTCDARLIHWAGRHEVLGSVIGMPGSIRHVAGAQRPTCPNEHPLPGDDILRQYRDRRGYSPTEPYREVLPPALRMLGRRPNDL